MYIYIYVYIYICMYIYIYTAPIHAAPQCVGLSLHDLPQLPYFLGYSLRSLQIPVPDPIPARAREFPFDPRTGGRERFAHRSGRPC